MALMVVYIGVLFLVLFGRIAEIRKGDGVCVIGVQKFGCVLNCTVDALWYAALMGVWTQVASVTVV